MWASFANVRQRRCISFGHHNEWIFATKLINDLLPTAARINRYSSNTLKDWKCALCTNDQDDIEHLCSCPETQQEWAIIISKLIKVTKKFALKHDLGLNAATLIRSILPNDKSLPTLTEHCRYIWLKGIIHASTVAQITKATKNTNLSHQLILSLITKIRRLFRTLIWNKRCSSQKAKELSMGINIATIAKEKRKLCSVRSRDALKRKKKKSPPHTSRLVVSPIPDDDEQQCLCLDDLPLVPAATAFTPDYDGMAKDWYAKGMDNWLVKGIKECWMFLKKGSIGKAGLDLVNSFLLRSSLAQTNSVELRPWDP
jgi:hypothetical protein